MVVGTWNLENLFRPGGDAGPSDQRAYDAKLSELARVIAELAPVVLAVQEVGDPEALDDLRERLVGDWHAESSALPDTRGIRVGFLSRLALSEVEQLRDFPDGLEPVKVDDEGTTIAAMGRGALRVRVRPGERDLDLVTRHLKSKLLTFPEGALARVTRASGPASPPMRSIAGRPRRSRCARSPTGCSTGRAASARWCCSATSTTKRRRPRPRSCSGRRGRRSTPPASSGPTGATARACGTSRL